MEDEPAGPFPLGPDEIGEPQVVVIVHKGLLESAVETFGVGVPHRGFGVGRQHPTSRDSGSGDPTVPGTGVVSLPGLGVSALFVP